MPADGGMAVWCVHKGDAARATAEVHFNYWRLAGDAEFAKRSRNTARDFAEIGILLRSPHDIKNVNIFLPHVVAAKCVEDCGKFFSSTDIAQGIFNELLTCNAAGYPGPQRIELLLNGGLFCRVYILPIDGGTISQSQLSIETDENGSVLTITESAVSDARDGLEQDGSLYFRIRVYIEREQEGPFIRVIRPHDRLLLSGFEEIEYVDFRLNEARTLPRTIESRMRQEQKNVKVPFTKVAFLTAVPVVADLTASSIDLHKRRLLEHDLWNRYVPSGIPDGMMVYHWRKDNPKGVEDFSAFVKLQTRRSGRAILAAYLVIAFAIGVVGNLLASGIVYGFAEWWPQLSNLFRQESSIAPLSESVEPAVQGHNAKGAA